VKLPRRCRPRTPRTRSIAELLKPDLRDNRSRPPRECFVVPSSTESHHRPKQIAPYRANPGIGVASGSFREPKFGRDRVSHRLPRLCKTQGGESLAARVGRRIPPLQRPNPPTQELTHPRRDAYGDTAHLLTRPGEAQAPLQPKLGSPGLNPRMDPLAGMGEKKKKVAHHR